MQGDTSDSFSDMHFSTFRICLMGLTVGSLRDNEILQLNSICHHNAIDYYLEIMRYHNCVDSAISIQEKAFENIISFDTFCYDVHFVIARY